MGALTVNLQGCLTGYAPWTPGADSLLRAVYPAGGILAAREAFPGRSVSSLFHRAARLGLSRRRHWTARDDANLREFWAEGLSLDTIARRLSRTRVTTYWRAQQLGINGKVPPGFERLSEAARRTGYTTGQLAEILRWAGKRLRVVLARPGPRVTDHRFRMVDWISLEDALAAWHKTETAEAAARRLGVNGDRLRARLAKIGLPTGKQRHRRLSESDVAHANAVAKYHSVVKLARSVLHAPADLLALRRAVYPRCNKALVYGDAESRKRQRVPQRRKVA